MLQLNRHDKSTLSEDPFNTKAINWLKYINGETQHATHAQIHTHTHTHKHVHKTKNTNNNSIT